jgi:Tol biopolymer transport system component
MRLLYLAPVLLLFAVAAGLVQRQASQQEWLASAYAAADSAASAGDLISARDGFSAIAGYRDATHRAAEIATRLRPLEANYIDGLLAIDEGEFAKAVELLAPVADEAPGLKDVATRLNDAKSLLANELRRDVDAAETVHDWPGAERILRQLVALDASDVATRRRLGSLQRERGPLLLGNDRALWLIAPDGSDPQQITDSLQVIWPVWSPDRAQIAFLAPDPDDPMGNVSLYTVGIDGASPRHLVDGVSAHAAPIWSPDGTRIAYTSFAGYDPVYETGSIGVRVVDVASGAETNVTGDDYTLAFNPTWSPDGEKLAFVVKHQGLDERPQHAPGDVVIVRPGEDGFTDVTEGAVRDVWSAAWSPQGDDLLVFSLFGQTWYEPPSTSIRLLHLPSGEITQIARIDEHATMPVWSPDASRFAFTADEKSIVFVDRDGQRVTEEAEEALSGEITWSPDGLALIFAPWNAGSPSTIVDLSGPAPALSTVRFEFDANPPFVSPPQWAPTVAIAPEDNPSIALPSSDVPSTS